MFFSIIFLIVVVILCICSMFLTAYINIEKIINYEIFEKVLYKFDNVFVTILLIFIVLLAIFVIIKLIKKVDKKIIFVIFMVCMGALGIFMICKFAIEPRGDMLNIYKAALDAIKGNFNEFNVDKYIGFYPYQMGMVFVVEVIIRIFGDSYIPVIVFNLLCLLVSYYGIYKITDILFDKDNITKISIILMGLFLQLFLYVLMIYGNIPGLAFGVMSVYFAISYLKSKKIWHLALSSILIVISILLKNNYMIFLIAEILMFAIFAIKNKDTRLACIGWIVCTFILNKVAYMGLELFYESRSNIQMTEGVPKSLFISMGLNENEKMENGWYDATTVLTYQKNNYDYDASNKEAKEQITKRIKEMIGAPVNTTKFFASKMVSQWCEPTFESIWINRPLYYEENFEKIDNSKILNSFFFGKLNRICEKYFDTVNCIIFLFSAVFFVINIKKIKNIDNVLAVIFIGGFAFHMISEAKSQYAVQYVFIIIPYAAAGINTLFEKIMNKKKTLEIKGDM